MPPTARALGGVPGEVARGGAPSGGANLAGARGGSPSVGPREGGSRRSLHSSIGRFRAHTDPRRRVPVVASR
jgi:hypothetical protein